ncbi:hypothetical protein CMK18_16570 [Candidatus Poribacteria bacterium]|nr:hypothetical protein [Candidatus Poribacteria bacterium]
MRFSVILYCFVCLLCFSLQFQALQAQQSIKLASNPNISPDGSQIAFSWRGDIWISSIGGGVAKQLIQNLAQDIQPKFSPDGSKVALVSNREGINQVFVISTTGGYPKQVIFYSEGSIVEGWYPNGQGLIIRGKRDHFWKRANRFFTISITGRISEKLLLDAYGKSGSFSPDGKQCC